MPIESSLRPSRASASDILSQGSAGVSAPKNAWRASVSGKMSRPALHEPRPNLLGRVAGGDSPTHQIAHVAGELGIGIGDRLSLADEAAQLFHQRLSFGLLTQIRQLAVRPIGWRQIAVSEQRLRD